MKYSLSLFLLLSCATIQQSNPRPSWELLLDSSVALTVTCPDGAAYQGSGVAVGPRRILTARHVVECDGSGPAAIEVKTRWGSSYEGFVAEMNEKGPDVAAVGLAGSGPGLRPVKIAPVKHRPKGRLCIYSANPWETWRYQCGSLVGWLDGKTIDFTDGTSIIGDGLMLYGSMSEPGTSGSGVFNDKDELVGIHAAKSLKTGLGWWLGVAIQLID